MEAAFGIAVVLTALAAATLLTVVPLAHRHDDDRGNGLDTVTLPRPRSVPLARVVSFYVTASALIGILAALRLQAAYQSAVASLASLVWPNNPLIGAYASHLSVDLRLIVAVNIVVFAGVIRAPLARRVVVAIHALLFAVLVVLVDVVGCLAGAEMRLTNQAFAIVGSLLILVIAVLVVLRLLTTTFMLPRPTAVPDRRVRHRSETWLLGIGVVLAMVTVVSLIDLVDTLFGLYHPTAFLVAFTGFPLLFDVMFGFLLLATSPLRRRHPTGGSRPPLTTVTPAFNEEGTITRTLEALDVAAGEYGGYVTVILVDDGSHDRTVEVASAAMARFRHAEGRLVLAHHGGKAAALNKGLALAKTEIVIRVDADVVVAPKALCFLPGWFVNPSVGMVGALALPDPRETTLYAKGRLFECLLGFAFARVALQRVDAVNCIPGTFTAFRAEPARRVGGFVSGMNGEDSDLTMQLGRLGYHVVVDTRIRTYEDVPGNLREFREQRVRWNRAGVHILARHSPVVAGGGSPRTWFFYIRAATVRITAVLRPFVFLTGLELSLLDPATRAVAPRVFVFYLVAALPTLAVIAVLAVRFGYGRKLVWLAVWFPFTLIRRMVALEGLMTLPAREVVLSFGRARVRPLSLEPVTSAPAIVSQASGWATTR
jgi:cellulose synthase/poly-beta-1,6-N-acetylglucosamine synthase-like glycosyltransferase